MESEITLLSRHAPIPRAPQLRKERIGSSTYWHTKAGGKDIYFGNVTDVPYKNSRQQFSEYAKSLSDGTARNNRLSTVEFMELFLA